jgi:hypothetical protein
MSFSMRSSVSKSDDGSLPESPAGSLASNITVRPDKFIAQLKDATQERQKLLLEGSNDFIGSYLAQAETFRRLVDVLYENNLAVLEEIITQKRSALSVEGWVGYLQDKGGVFTSRKPVKKLKCLFVARKCLPSVFEGDALKRREFINEIIDVLGQLSKTDLNKFSIDFMGQLELWRLLFVPAVSATSGGDLGSATSARKDQITKLRGLLTNQQLINILFEIADFFKGKEAVSFDEFGVAKDFLEIFTDACPLDDWSRREDAITILVQFRFHDFYPLDQCVDAFPAALQADYLVQASALSKLPINDFAKINSVLRAGELFGDDEASINRTENRINIANNVERQTKFMFNCFKNPREAIVHLDPHDRGGCLSFVTPRQRKELLAWSGFYLCVPPSNAIAAGMAYPSCRPQLPLALLKTYSMKQLYVLSHVLSTSSGFKIKPSVSIKLFFEAVDYDSLQSIEKVLRFLFLSNLFRFKCLSSEWADVQAKFNAVYPGNFPLFSCGSVWLSDVGGAAHLSGEKASDHSYESSVDIKNGLKNIFKETEKAEEAKRELIKRAGYFLSIYAVKNKTLYAFTEMLLLCEKAQEVFPELCSVLHKAISFFMKYGADISVELLGEIESFSGRKEAYLAHLETQDKSYTIDSKTMYTTNYFFESYTAALLSAEQLGPERSLFTVFGGNFHQQSLQLLSGKSAEVQLGLMRQWYVDGQVHLIYESLADFCDLIKILEPNILVEVFSELLFFDWLDSVGPSLEEFCKIVRQVFDRYFHENVIKQALCFYLLVKPLYERFGNDIVLSQFLKIIKAQNYHELVKIPELSKIIIGSDIAFVLFSNGAVEAFNLVSRYIAGGDLSRFLRPIAEFIKGIDITSASEEVKTLLFSCWLLLWEAGSDAVKDYIGLSCHRFKPLHTLVELLPEQSRLSYMKQAEKADGIFYFVDYEKCSALVTDDEEQLEFSSIFAKHSGAVDPDALSVDLSDQDVVEAATSASSAVGGNVNKNVYGEMPNPDAVQTLFAANGAAPAGVSRAQDVVNGAASQLHRRGGLSSSLEGGFGILK